MPKPRTYQTEAIVIKKTRLGEADSILTLYTPHLGKIQGFAKSLRKPKSKLAGHLELLTHSLVSLARGRNLDTITGSQTINSFLPLKSDLYLAAHALYATELINQFTAAEDSNYPLFRSLLETMHNLCQADDKELVLRYFELQLLNEVGYRPQLQQCVACHSPLELTTNSFCPGAGGMLCPGCSQSHHLTYPIQIDALKTLRLLQSNDYNITRKLKMNPILSHQVEETIRNYIKYLLERDLKSVGWLDTLREQTGGASV
jgi:DNA repair protein RecO (recombination protein O)